MTRRRKPTKGNTLHRREPRQRRARQTVEAILDAVVRILKREGFDAITTNHIAEIAGVSIGSLYQYFPDKRAIFVALHGRHIEEIDRVIQSTLVEHASSSLEELLRALVEAMIGAHLRDPELFELLASEVPHRADGSRHFAVRLHGAFRLAIAARTDELDHGMRKGRSVDKMAFVAAHMVESLAHGALFRRPNGLSLGEAKDEIVRAVLAYLRA
jgi:AcrR family transcriptional regulator